MLVTTTSKQISGVFPSFRRINSKSFYFAKFEEHTMQSESSLCHLQIAAELNNIGAFFHKLGRVDFAEDLFRDAMEAMHDMNEIFDGGDNYQLEEEVIQQACGPWKEKLVQRRAMAPHLCGINVEINNSSFSQTVRIDVQDLRFIDAETVSAVVLYNSAQVQVKKGSLDKAIKLLEMSLSLMPSEVDVRCVAAVTCIATYHNLGELYLQRQQEEKSIQMLEAALHLGHETLGDHVLVASTLNTVGRLVAKKGHINDAMEIFDEASRIYDKHTVEAANVGSRRESSGDAAAAAA